MSNQPEISPNVPENKPVLSAGNNTVPTSVLIQKDIKDRVLEKNPEVRESYIKQEVAAKLDSRVKLVQKAMVELATQKKEFDKARADDVKYDADGKVVQELFSKAVIETRKKVAERSAKIEKALTKALESGDYSDLEKAL